MCLTRMRAYHITHCRNVNRTSRPCLGPLRHVCVRFADVEVFATGIRTLLQCVEGAEQRQTFVLACVHGLG